MAATQANASKPEAHTAPFIWCRPAPSQLDAANLPGESILGTAVKAVAAELRVARSVTAGFDNRYLGSKRPSA
ncbi:hypothetical protein [Actinomadura sp. B10D3]|uniref:hypothetical protein n=1 Tax=Actinomadura sp. B10D3 TaxID=3153557 RepID=UPI00325D2579